MKATALGALVRGTGWLAIVTGFLLGSLPLALAGTFLVTAVEATRWRLASAPVRGRREVSGPLRIGDEGRVRTVVESDAPVPLWVDDVVPAPLQALRTRSDAGRGTAWQETDVVAVDAGRAEWHDVAVRIADPWAMHALERRIEVPTSVEVSPEPDWVTHGRRAGRRHTVQTLVKGRRATESLPQVEAVREYQPGDRLRDIDWKRSSRMSSLHTKVRERVVSRPMLILLDAGASMRHRRHHAKITSAARLAYGLCAAAQGAGIRARITSFDDHGIMHAGPRLSEVVQRLGTLDAPVPVARVQASGDGFASDRAERGFLGLLGLVAAGVPPAPPMEAAVGEMMREEKALVVAILDADEAPQATRAAVARLRRNHDVVLVIPSSPAHHVRRDEAAGQVASIETTLSARSNLIKRMGVPAFVLRPTNVEQVIQGVAKSAE